MGSLITLTTDFGISDAYVPSMKGVILRLNPQATIVDITHDIEPQNILQGAFVFGSAYKHFPPGTIHLVVVDPGVGTERRAVLLATPEATFIGPDNGVLSYVLADLSPNEAEPEVGALRPYRWTPPQGARAYHLNNRRWWLPRVSSTFHGRDIFAPVAAHLTLGARVEDVGDETHYLEALYVPRPVRLDERTIEGCILHIDRFGNLIASIQEWDLPRADIEVKIGEKVIHGLVSSYAQGEGLLALIGSNGNLEIAVRNGSAQKTLGARVGDRITVSWGEDAS